MPTIHEKAHVDIRTCAVGAGTMVWQFASVIRGAKVGYGCTIAANAIVDGAVVGDCTLVGHAASIHPGTRIGRRCFIGPGVICCNDFWPTALKEGFDKAQLLTRPVIVIEDDASIGAGVIILPGVTIGRGSMVAAGVVVERSLPPDHLLHRDGRREPMPGDRGMERRMRWAD